MPQPAQQGLHPHFVKAVIGGGGAMTQGNGGGERVIEMAKPPRPSLKKQKFLVAGSKDRDCR